MSDEVSDSTIGPHRVIFNVYGRQPERSQWEHITSHHITSHGMASPRPLPPLELC